MSMQSKQAFVIVERTSGWIDTIRSSLLKTGAKVHIFQSFAAALVMLARKKVDGVVVEFDNAKVTADFCAAVRRLKVPIVFSTAHATARDKRQFGFEVNFPRRRDTPTIFLPYRRPTNKASTSLS